MEQDSCCASRNFEKAAGHVGIWSSTVVVVKETLRRQQCKQEHRARTAAVQIGTCEYHSVRTNATTLAVRTRKRNMVHITRQSQF